MPTETGIGPGGRRYWSITQPLRRKRLKYGPLIRRLRRRAQIMKEINETHAAKDLLAAATALSELKV